MEIYLRNLPIFCRSLKLRWNVTITANFFWQNLITEDHQKKGRNSLQKQNNETLEQSPSKAHAVA